MKFYQDFYQNFFTILILEFINRYTKIVLRNIYWDYTFEASTMLEESCEVQHDDDNPLTRVFHVINANNY